MTWTPVCPVQRVPIARGVCVLVAGQQVALFRTTEGLFALGNRDPFSGAYVLSRGILGSRADRPTVASPMYKQAFDLATGVCLDDPQVSVPVHDVRVVDGVVHVRLAGELPVSAVG